MTRRPPDRPAPDRRRRRALWSLGGLGAVAAGCGGGVAEVAGIGSGGTGQVAGTTFSAGPISGFGSVIVNGVKFDDSAATVTDSLGRARRLGELGLGMVVEIDGDADPAAGTGTARSIRIIPQLAGTVASVDAPAGRFVALGVDVETDASTAWGTAEGIAAVRAGGPVQVWGFADPASGVLRASRVDARADVDGLALLRGPASGYDRARARISVGGHAVALDAAGAARERIDDGTEVRVAGPAVPPGQTLRATRIEVDAPERPASVAEARLDGAIRRFESASRFTVAGLRVDAAGATVSGGAAGSLRDGTRVRVIGPVSGGTLVARTLEIRAVRGGAAAATPGGNGNGAAPGDTGGGADPDGTRAPPVTEDPAQVRGTIVSAAPLSALVIRDAQGREFTLDASGAKVVGGTVADLFPGVAVSATGLRGNVLRSVTLRIER